MQPDAQTILDAMEGVAYLTDPDCRIVGVGRRNWAEFALENGGAGLATEGSVVGTDLFRWIDGTEVRRGYRAVLDQLAQRPGHAISVPARCDSVPISRDTRLTMSALRTPAGPAGFLFQSLVVNERHRPPVPLFDFEKHRDPSLPPLAMCSICERVLHGGGWIEGQDYYGRGGGSRVRIEHTMCPDCAGRLLGGNS